MQPVPFLKRRFEERLDDDGAGMVEEHGHRAEALLDARHGSIDGVFLRDIGRPAVRLAAGMTDLLDGLGGRRAIAVDDRDARAFGRKQLRGSTAHAGRAA
ncbi:hypothetical protein GA0061105_108161 [Rhizobium aethiopicum]|uniref:Uncharacterized protein n=1 Tax=Rhizobium aethiopicum TaxID=1138170 RepID=A0A1C3Y5P7_9HYPH|nr:hypothetical protein GA0061105_108161 [Rhizobium aethiopicum]